MNDPKDGLLTERTTIEGSKVDQRFIQPSEAT
jgi:hypothetical protein